MLRDNLPHLRILSFILQAQREMIKHSPQEAVFQQEFKKSSHSRDSPLASSQDGILNHMLSTLTFSVSMSSTRTRNVF